jgi:hypothetical protein
MNIILPIIVLVLFAGFIYMVNSARKYVTVKITHWLLIIYTGTLLLAIAISPMILIYGMPEIENKQKVNMFEALMKGETEKVPLLAEDSFAYERQSLSIHRPVGIDEGTPIFIERKTNDDRKIDAYVFASGMEVNGYDFSKRLLPNEVSITDDTLTILPPTQQKIDIAMVKKEFTINQFTGKKDNENRIIGHEGRAVYLRIPKGLKIETNSIPVTFVN